MGHDDHGVRDPHHHGLAPPDQSSLLPGASPTLSQAADLHQATSTNGTGIPTALLKHGIAPSPVTAQAAATKEVPVAREAPSPDGSPKLGGAFVRAGHAAGMFISRTPSSFAAGWRLSSPSPYPSSPCHCYSSSPALVLMHILVLHAGPAGSLISDRTSLHAHVALSHL